MVSILYECVLNKLISMYLISWCFLSSIWASYLFYQLEFDDFLIWSIICFINWNWWFPYLLISLYLYFFFLNELLHSISSNKLVMICIGGQISVVQALSEELPRQFLTYIRGRDIKPHCLHVAPTFAWEHFLGPQDVQICWFCSQQLKVLKGLNH